MKLRNIKINDDIGLKWNTNKTEEEFILRIKSRINLSLDLFLKTVEICLNQVYSKLSEESDSCVYFMVSKFVLIVSKKENKIRTIRDGRWDKPANGCDKISLVMEEFEMKDLIENVLFHETQFDGYNIIPNADFILEVHTDCDVCLKVYR